MRIDKYLKNARIIKRRTIAKEACDAGKILINDRVAKAGSEISIGDVLTIKLGMRVFKIEVLGISEHVSKEQSKDLFKNLE